MREIETSGREHWTGVMRRQIPRLRSEWQKGAARPGVSGLTTMRCVMI